MAYNWPQLTNEKITSDFLYGTDTPPADLTSESLVRPPPPAPPPNGYPQAPVQLELDAVTLMTTGPGRFALPGVNSDLVAGFMDPDGRIQADGMLHKYTLAEMITSRLRPVRTFLLRVPEGRVVMLHCRRSSMATLKCNARWLWRNLSDPHPQNERGRNDSREMRTPLYPQKRELGCVPQQAAIGRWRR